MLWKMLSFWVWPTQWSGCKIDPILFPSSYHFYWISHLTNCFLPGYWTSVLTWKREEKTMLVKMAISRPICIINFNLWLWIWLNSSNGEEKKNATSIKSRHRFCFTGRLSLAICHSRRQKYKFYTRKHFSLRVQLCQFRRYQHSSIELHVICVCNIKILSPSHPQRWTWRDASSTSGVERKAIKILCWLFLWHVDIFGWWLFDVGIGMTTGECQ